MKRVCGCLIKRSRPAFPFHYCRRGRAVDLFCSRADWSATGSWAGRKGDIISAKRDGEAYRNALAQAPFNTVTHSWVFSFVRAHCFSFFLSSATHSRPISIFHSELYLGWRRRRLRRERDDSIASSLGLLAEQSCPPLVTTLLFPSWRLHLRPSVSSIIQIHFQLFNDNDDDGGERSWWWIALIDSLFIYISSS